ncbi:MAG: hypothetical protein L6R00_00805 [Phycisphaerae bacterium]|nr:hypothetical protein [Phycisphaerae bacterium]
MVVGIRISSLLRGLVLAIGAVTIAAGCAEREPEYAAVRGGIGTPGRVAVFTEQASYNAVLLADQSSVKPPSAPDVPADQIPDVLGENAPRKAVAAGDGGEEGAAPKTSAKGLLSGLGKLKGLLGGGNKAAAQTDEADVSGGTGADAEDVATGSAEPPEKKEDKPAPPSRGGRLRAGRPAAEETEATGGTSEEDQEEEEAEEEEEEEVDPLRDKARPMVNEVPKNPADRASQGIEVARKAAVNDALKRLIDAALALPIKGGGVTLIAILGDEKEAKQTQLSPYRVVAMRWIDADKLEVEVEITLSDLATSLKKRFPDVDLSPLTELGESKCLPAKGQGIIPPNMRSGNRALPGERAREAGEGGGI